MVYDIALKKGDPGKPAVFFIHGLGMDKRVWESPDDSRILGGRFPVSLLIPGGSEAGAPQTLHTLFHDLSERGYTVIAWSQKRPSAEIAVAVSELRALTVAHREYCRSGIILIGHSRGGLVARAYVKDRDERVLCLITLATPHKGSGMAQWVKYITPLVSVLNPLIPESEKGTLPYAVKRIFDFLRSKAVRELLPDSTFFKDLADGPLKGVYSLSIGGKDPTLFSFYRTVRRKGSGLKARRLFSIPEVLERVIPRRFFPEEMKKGKGDGLVSIESSRLPWADEHYDFDLNHAAILFDDRVRRRVAEALEKTGSDFA